MDPALLSKIENPIVVLGIMALVVFELVKRVEIMKARQAYQNGDSPFITACHDLRDAINAGFMAQDKRMSEHESREERQWEKVNGKMVEAAKATAAATAAATVAATAVATVAATAVAARLDRRP
jgi:hypothetical protein